MNRDFKQSEHKRTVPRVVSPSLHSRAVRVCIDYRLFSRKFAVRAVVRQSRVAVRLCVVAPAERVCGCKRGHRRQRSGAGLSRELTLKACVCACAVGGVLVRISDCAVLWGLYSSPCVVQ